MRFPAPILAVVIALAFVTLPPVVRSNDEDARVLFDFGDGSYAWSEIVLGANHSAFNVTLRAAEKLNLNVTYQWFSFGVMIQDIGDRHPSSPLWWHLLVWNRTADEWNTATAGASDLILGGGDVIAWSLSASNPVTYQSPPPSPTPLNPYPHLYFRQDLHNSGMYPGKVCGDLQLLWKYNTGAFEISGTPASSGGLLFVPTWEGLFALRADTGSFVWKRSDIRGMSSPAVYGGGLFVGANDGRLHHLSVSDGGEIWNTSLVAHPIFTGISSSPKPYEDKVFVGLFNESGGLGGVVALDIWSGKVVWKKEASSVHMSSPSVIGDTLFIGIAGRFNESSISFDPPYGLLALNISDGSERWFLQTGGSVASSPLVLGSSVVFTSRDGYLRDVGFNGTELWRSAIAQSTSSPATDGKRIIVGDGVLGRSGNVTVFSATGEILWARHLTGPIQASPLYADGRVFVATNEENGAIYAISSKTGDVVWAFTPSPSDYMLSQPVVTDGRLFAASDNGWVYAFGCARPESPSDNTLTYAVVITSAVAIAAVAGVFRLRKVWR